jgi:hypothetical protein
MIVASPCGTKHGIEAGSEVQALGPSAVRDRWLHLLLLHRRVFEHSPESRVSG